MSDELPTGERESQRQEFKASAILRDPYKLAREVVAMLNAEGGSVWIGVPEDGGVALPPTPIDHVAEERERLHARLHDLIEPAPLSSEVRVVAVAVEGGKVLRVDVESAAGDGRRPFAWRKGGMVGFDRRDDHRVVAMDRDEVRAAFRGEVHTADLAADWLQARAEEARRPAGEARIWIGLAADAFEPDRDERIDDELQCWWLDLLDPRRFPRLAPSQDAILRNPRMSIVSGLEPRRHRTLLKASLDAHDPSNSREVTAWSSGALEVTIPTRALEWVDSEASPETQRQIHPYRLIGLFGSFCELGAELIERGSALVGGVRIRAELNGLTALALRAHSPASREYSYWKRDEDLRTLDADERTVDLSLRADVDRFVTNPHAAAIGLVERIYARYGFTLDDLPNEIDDSRDRIYLPR
ncbi:MAG: ATP-binding protein [Planctomycetota bacterium]